MLFGVQRTKPREALLPKTKRCLPKIYVKQQAAIWKSRFELQQDGRVVA